jgi:hypothetical protein
VLARFREDVPDGQIEALAASYGRRRAGRLRGKSRVERLTTGGRGADEIIAAIGQSPLVEFIEPNYVVTADQIAGSSTDPSVERFFTFRQSPRISAGVPRRVNN